MKVSHVMLGVESAARSIPFYRDTLGLALQATHEGFAFFDAGGFTLALSEGLARANQNRVGATEIVLGVESVRDSYDQLRARGVEFINEPHAVAGPMFAVNFKDPDGHGFSLFGPEKKP